MKRHGRWRTRRQAGSRHVAHGRTVEKTGGWRRRHAAGPPSVCAETAPHPAGRPSPRRRSHQTCTASGSHGLAALWGPEPGAAATTRTGPCPISARRGAARACCRRMKNGMSGMACMGGSCACKQSTALPVSGAAMHVHGNHAPCRRPAVPEQAAARAGCSCIRICMCGSLHNRHTCAWQPSWCTTAKRRPGQRGCGLIVCIPNPTSTSPAIALWWRVAAAGRWHARVFSRRQGEKSQALQARRPAAHRRTAPRCRGQAGGTRRRTWYTARACRRPASPTGRLG